MAGLSGFAGVFGGNPAGSYQDSRKKQQGLDQGDVDAQAQAAAGNAYMGMFGGQQTPGQPPGAQGAGMPGQPQQGGAPPQQPGLGGLLQGLLQKLQGAGGGGMQPQPPGGGMPPQPQMPPPGPGPGGSQPAPGGAPPGLPQQGAVPGARPMQMPGAGASAPQQGPPAGAPAVGSPGPGMAAMPPSSASMPGQPQGGPQGQPQGGPQGQPQGGQLTWQSIVQQVVKANPGVKDPRVIAAAVDKFVPIMNSQSLMEWRQQQANLRGYNADTSRERADTSKDQGQQRIDQSGQRIDISRGESERKTEQGGKRLEQGDRRLDQGDRRENRLDRAQVLKQDQQHSMLEMQEKRLQSQIAANKDRTMLGQWRAIVNAQHARAQEIISSAAAGMDPKERKRLLDEEDKAYTDKIKEMKGIMDGGDKPKGSMAGKPGEEIIADKPAATKVASPEEAAKLKPGTRYTTPDGTEYTR